MDTFLVWFGVMFIGVISIWIPRTVLVIIGWNILEYGFGGGIILVILTIFALVVDIAEGMKDDQSQ